MLQCVRPRHTSCSSFVFLNGSQKGQGVRSQAHAARAGTCARKHTQQWQGRALASTRRKGRDVRPQAHAARGLQSQRPPTCCLRLDPSLALHPLLPAAFGAACHRRGLSRSGSQLFLSSSTLRFQPTGSRMELAQPRRMPPPPLPPKHPPTHPVPFKAAPSPPRVRPSCDVVGSVVSSC
jgi:hypothetical protein